MRAQSDVGAREPDGDAAAMATARADAYSLLAELLARGIRPDRVDRIVASPALASALRSYIRASKEPALDLGALDELAADHQHAFGWNACPLEGALLDPEGCAGGASSARLAGSYRLLGFEPDPCGEDPEHLATELAALAWASRGEARALRRGDAITAAGLREKMRAFLDRHPLRWVPAWAAAVRRLEHVFPAALAGQVELLLLVHRSALGRPHASDVCLALPPVDLDLDDARAGLAEVARMLCVPARAGLLVTRDDLSRSGRALGVPRGFGARSTMMQNLLRSAAHLEALVPLLDSLVHLVATSRAAFDAEHYEAVPGMASLLAPWRTRLDETRALLERMAAEAIPLQADPEVHGGG